MIFAPEQKTATGERPSSSRSADSSSGRPRWTPPMPPVAIKRIPAIAATRIVAATVVAPTEPCATAVPRSRELTLTEAAATRSSPVWLNPTHSRPSSTATVAGTPPSSRIAASQPSAARMLCGAGRPCPRIDVSRLTTGRRCASAAATSSEIRSRWFSWGALQPAARIPRPRAPHVRRPRSGPRRAATRSRTRQRMRRRRR